MLELAHVAGPRIARHRLLCVRQEHGIGQPIAVRGQLREGYWGDIVIFDPDRVADTATYENPKQYPKGIDYVLVNGTVVIDNGQHTAARPGKVVYGPGYAGR